jgi:alkylated DNA repair dioxygenase AlkB
VEKARWSTAAARGRTTAKTTKRRRRKRRRVVKAGQTSAQHRPKVEISLNVLSPTNTRMQMMKATRRRMKRVKKTTVKKTRKATMKTKTIMKTKTPLPYAPNPGMDALLLAALAQVSYLHERPDNLL